MTEHLVPADGCKPIPSFQFSTESISADEQFDGYREFMTPLSDVEPLALSGRGFRAHAQVYDLGALQLASLYNDPATFSYSRKHMRQFGMEHWSLNVVAGGSIRYASGNGLEGAAGDMFAHSYTSAFSGVAENLELLHVMLNRDDFHDVADELDGMIDRKLTGPMSSILRDFLISLGSCANGLSMAEIPAVNGALSHLLKAALRPNPDTLEAARLPIAATQFAMAKRIIADNLKSPDLSPDMICARIGISRRQLFYIFEKHGGVMKFINQRRLAACYGALVAQAERTMVSSIAYEYGFTSLSPFYRQFKERYGFSPSEARSAWLNGHGPRKTGSGSFANWLLRTDDT